MSRPSALLRARAGAQGPNGVSRPSERAACASEEPGPRANRRAWLEAILRFAILVLLGWTAPDGIESARMRSSRSHTREPSVSKIIRIGIDTSKSVFQLHGVDAAENPILRKKLRRQQFLAFVAKLDPTQIGLEACGAAHHWARELSALGHEIVLLPPQYVKPYVKRGKHDAADAEAICEAMSRPSMRFVPVKTAEQQAALMLAGTRDQLVRRRTQLTNTIRGYAAEFGLTAAKGVDKIEPLLARVASDAALPELAKELFAAYRGEYAGLKRQIQEIEAKLMAWHKDSELSRRLVKVPAIGPIGASLLAMKVADPHAFRSGRDFWLGSD